MGEVNEKIKAPYNVLDDTYRLYVPIEDDGITKSIEVDENGDYIVQGVMTSDSKDEEDDSIAPEGMDCSYFLEKGWIKYEHGNKPEQFIGEPIEIKIGRFEHPTLMKSVNGIFVKGRLFATRSLTKQAIEAMQDLQKSNTKRRMGWSIEGNVKERCKKTGKIIKSVLRNVVLTMNPVNTTTWAELAKSFAKDHELTIDMPEPKTIDKAMTLQGTQAVRRQSIEGYDPEKDEQEKWVKMFRSFVRNAVIDKSLRELFVTSPKEAELLAFEEALTKGLDYEEAESFASYIAEKQPILKKAIAIITYGGETMSEKDQNAKQNAKETLANLLDTDLEELQKSLELDEETEETEEEIQKAIDTESDDAGDDEGEDETEGDGDEDGEDGDEGDDEEVEKSYKTDLSKSLAEGGHSQAFEVSDFLADLTDEIGFSLSGIEKSMGNVTKQQHIIVKALTTMGDMVKTMTEENASLRNEVTELQKSLNDVMSRPVGRKGVVSQREVQTLSKSLDSQGQVPTTRKEVEEILFKSFEKGEIPGSVITKYEAGVPLKSMNLPDDLKKSLGFE